MATIKTTGIGDALRIITKTVSGQVRVSCGCCEQAGCCMYPAQGLIDGLFTVADLPDEIAMSSNGGDVLSKINPPVPAFGADGITMYYGLAGEGVGIEDATGGWVFFQDGGINEDVIVPPACLFSDTNIPQTPPFDVFEDTYTLTSIDGSIVVTRVSLCRWELTVEVGSPNLGGSLEYFPINPVEGQPSPAWAVGMNDGQGGSPAGGEKTSPNLASPVGTYTYPFLPSVTVS